jgi:hypothetical protein
MDDLACLYALQSRPDLALSWLERAIAGYPLWRAQAQTDEHFAALQRDSRFRALVGLVN